MKLNIRNLTSAALFSLALASCSNSQQSAPNFEPEAYSNNGNGDTQYVGYNPSVYDPPASPDETFASSHRDHYEKYQHVERPGQSNYDNFSYRDPSQKMDAVATPAKDQNGLTMQPLMDPQSGMPYGHYPLPASWSIKNDAWYGPDGIKVEYFFKPVQNVQQTPYQSPEQLLKTELTSLIQSKGGTIQHTYSLPAIAKNDQVFQSMMLLYPDQQKCTVAAMGVDVYKPGEPGMILIRSSKTSNPYGSTWHQTVIVLSAKDSNIQQAKETLIYALSNFKPHMPYIRQFMQKEQQKANQHWANHNTRMRTNQRNFEATNRASQEAHAAVNDATMASYRSQSEAFDRNNQRIHNGIYNENTVTNPYDGTKHQTDAMYERTFMDPFGEQIQTNDLFYTPEQGYEEVFPDGGGY